MMCVPHCCSLILVTTMGCVLFRQANDADIKVPKGQGVVMTLGMMI